MTGIEYSEPRFEIRAVAPTETEAGAYLDHLRGSLSNPEISTEALDGDVAVVIKAELALPAQPALVVPTGREAAEAAMMSTIDEVKEHLRRVPNEPYADKLRERLEGIGNDLALEIVATEDLEGPEFAFHTEPAMSVGFDGDWNRIGMLFDQLAVTSRALYWRSYSIEPSGDEHLAFEGELVMVVLNARPESPQPAVDFPIGAPSPEGWRWNPIDGPQAPFARH